MAWEIIFMLVILKIPIVYIAVVIWWAIKAEPEPGDLAGVTAVSDTPSPGSLRVATAEGPPAGSSPHAGAR